MEGDEATAEITWSKFALQMRFGVWCCSRRAACKIGSANPPWMCCNLDDSAEHVDGS